MGTTMGTGNVHDDDTETLQFADEGEHEAYAQAELDQDRNPTAEGFAAWVSARDEAGRMSAAEADTYYTTLEQQRRTGAALKAVAELRLAATRYDDHELSTRLDEIEAALRSE